MKQDELLERLNIFEKDLDALIELWKQIYNAIESSPSLFNPNKRKELIQQLKLDINRQTNNLLKQFGGIEAYIDYFDNKHYKRKLVKNFQYFLIPAPKIDSYTSGFDLEPFTSFFERFQTRIMPIIPQIKGKLESMSPDDDFILDSSSDTPFVYLKASNNKIDINEDDLMKLYLDNLHPIIIKSSKEKYLDGYYTHSVEVAIRAMYVYIQSKTGLTIDGEDLINQAFSEKSENSLKFSDLSIRPRKDEQHPRKHDPEKDEQVGFMNMLKGFNQGVRNVFAHSEVTLDPQIAFGYLVMVSLFCKRIDQTKKYGISEPIE